jgi:molecular chaperone HscB
VIENLHPCWSCGAQLSSEALCPSCGKVQPPPPAGTQRNKFAFFGLQPSLDVDDAALDAQFRQLQRKLHPDRFVKGTAQERRFSLEQTTLLNDSYKTLKDPVRRTEHLLQLRGVSGEPKMSPQFLEETLDDREKLQDAKASGEPLDGLADGVRAKRDGTLQEVRTLIESGGDLSQAAELLARMKYYARYLDEVEGREPEI